MLLIFFTGAIKKFWMFFLGAYMQCIHGPELINYGHPVEANLIRNNTAMKKFSSNPDPMHRYLLLLFIN